VNRAVKAHYKSYSDSPIATLFLLSLGSGSGRNYKGIYSAGIFRKYLPFVSRSLRWLVEFQSGDQRKVV
jgi:hypothetical protein